MAQNDQGENGVDLSERSVAEQRDGTADIRDVTADGRDGSADERDRIADVRDRVADDRDSVAEQFEILVRAGLTTEASQWAVLAREDARADRRQASADRRVSAAERRQAEHDREASIADRHASSEDRQSASVDGLTGVYRRDAGFAELEREVARAHRLVGQLVVAFLDIDHLKSINDLHGHAAGDEMILTVAQTLRAELRSYDLIFRYGGDEIVCAMPGIAIAEARRRFDLVNALLADRPEHGSVTVGFANLQRADTAHTLVARADTAMYQTRTNVKHLPA